MNFVVFLLTLYFIGSVHSAEAGDTKRLYFLKPGYRLNHTQYKWSHDVIGLTADSLSSFEISSGNVTLENEVLIKTNWEFSLHYRGATSYYSYSAHPGQSGPSDSLTLKAKYRRTGPLEKCHSVSYDGFEVNSIEGVEWVDTWDLISARVQIELKSNQSNLIILPTQTSERPDRNPFTIKDPLENGCRNIFENTLKWENIEKQIETALAGSADFEGVDNLSFKFDITFISQTENDERIRKYNVDVAVTKKEFKTPDN